MSKRLSSHFRANVVGYLALFVALSGTAFASGVLTKSKVNHIISSRAPGLSVAQAKNADNLGGSPPSAFHDSCPSGTMRAAADLCVTTSDVGTLANGTNNWDDALHRCAALGFRLPSTAEAPSVASALASLGTADQFWTDDFYSSSAGNFALIYTTDVAGEVDTTIQSVRCVTTPQNS